MGQGRQAVLRAGDTLTIPKGWRIEFRGAEVHISGPGCMFTASGGFSLYEFIKCAAAQGAGNEVR